MDERQFAEVKALVEAWDEEWGCGPYEDCLPEDADLQKLNALTGQDWEAEDVREICFEYSCRNSLEETAYYLIYGDYPAVKNINLVFYRLKPGAVLDPKTVYEKYRLGNQMKALIPLPMEEITEALQNVPGFQAHEWDGFEPEHLRMNGEAQPDPWSDVHFWAFWYGGRKNPRPDHLLCLSCHNLNDEQIQTLIDLLAGFDLPVQYREEDQAF